MALAINVLNLIELSQANSCLYISHSEIKAQRIMIVTNLHPVIAQQTALFCDCIITGCDYPALTGHHILCGIEAERPCPKTAGKSIMLGGGDGLTGILDHCKTMFFGNFLDAIHICYMTVEMHRHNRPRPGCYRGFNGFRIDIESLIFDVNELASHWQKGWHLRWLQS